jgi:hypothetical protein
VDSADKDRPVNTTHLERDTLLLNPLEIISTMSRVRMVRRRRGRLLLTPVVPIVPIPPIRAGRRRVVLVRWDTAMEVLVPVPPLLRTLRTSGGRMGTARSTTGKASVSGLIPEFTIMAPAVVGARVMVVIMSVVGVVIVMVVIAVVRFVIAMVGFVIAVVGFVVAMVGAGAAAGGTMAVTPLIVPLLTLRARRDVVGIRLMDGGVWEAAVLGVGPVPMRRAAFAARRIDGVVLMMVLGDTVALPLVIIFVGLAVGLFTMSTHGRKNRGKKGQYGEKARDDGHPEKSGLGKRVTIAKQCYRFGTRARSSAPAKSRRAVA